MAFSTIYSPAFLEHRPRDYHPENPERLMRAIESLKRAGLWESVIEPEPVPEKELLRVHSAEYVNLVKSLSGKFAYIDPDTYVSPGTWGGGLEGLWSRKESR